MSRYATWRRGPSDPTTARRWMLGGAGPPVYGPRAVPATPRARKLVVWGSVGGLAFILVAILFLPKALPLVPVVAAFGARGALGLRRQPRSYGGDGPGESLWVRMSVGNAEGLATGTDHGWLILSEGWLLFEGERTSFAITRREATQVRHEAVGCLRLGDRRTVAFSPVGEKPDPKPLERIVREWEASPLPEGDAILPPRETHPEVLADRYAWSLIGSVLGLGVAAAIGGARWMLAMPTTVMALALAASAARCARGLRVALAALGQEPDGALTARPSQSPPTSLS